MKPRRGEKNWVWYGAVLVILTTVFCVSMMHSESSGYHSVWCLRCRCVHSHCNMLGVATLCWCTRGLWTVHLPRLIFFELMMYLSDMNCVWGKILTVHKLLSESSPQLRPMTECEQWENTITKVLLSRLYLWGRGHLRRTAQGEIFIEKLEHKERSSRSGVSFVPPVSGVSNCCLILLC